MAVTERVETFNPKLVIGMIAAGIVTFAVLLLLLAYGGSSENRPEGRAHVQSVAATGYKGLVQLAGELGNAAIVETTEDQYGEDLLVVALETSSRPEPVRALLDRRQGRATLLILPKWLTVRDPTRRGWVRPVGRGAGAVAASLFGRKLIVDELSGDPPSQAVGENILTGFSLPVPAHPQLISGEGVTPLVSVGGQGALVARLGEQPHYVVADPDLLNNHGLRDQATARSALGLIDALNATGAKGVSFDTSTGLPAGSQRGTLLKLAFEPPFLAMSIALAFAALLAGLHGAFRFGPTREDERAIAFGKTALVENSAGLIRLAHREARMGRAYLDVVRQDAARITGAPPGLTGAELDSYLDRISKNEGRQFSTLAGPLEQAGDRHALVAAARALFQWKKEITR